MEIDSVANCNEFEAIGVFDSISESTTKHLLSRFYSTELDSRPTTAVRPADTSSGPKKQQFCLCKQNWLIIDW